MAVKFNAKDPKFFNEYINGSTFSLNPTVFSKTLKGNVGELVKVEHELSFTVSINTDKTVSIEYKGTTDPTYGEFISDSIDWVNEGVFAGAFLDILYNGLEVNGVEVLSISGNNNNTLNVVKAGLVSAGISDGCRPDYEFYVTTAPKYLLFGYGLNGADQSDPNYKSTLDNNEQLYYSKSLATSPTLSTLTFKGNEIGSDLSESVEASFVSSSVDKRTHTYELEHIFRIPFYIEGEINNVETVRTPQTTARPINVKYGYGFWFGDSTDTAISFENVGGVGRGRSSVGYFDQNFDGQESNYLISSYTITNSFGTNTIEATLTNTITFSIVPVAPAVFGGSEDVILYISKLPTEAEYKNSKEAFNDVWLFDSIMQREGAAAGGSGIITNATVTYNGGTGNLDISFDASFSASEQEKISGSLDTFVTFATVGTIDLTDAESNDRTTLKGEVSPADKDTQQYGLITQYNLEIFEQWDYDTGTKAFTNFDGYNGDLLGQKFNFLTDVTVGSLIRSFDFKIVLDDGTDYHELYKYTVPISKISTVTVAPYDYQIMNINAAPIINNFNFSSSELVNEVLLYATVPGAPTTTQQWFGKIGFQIPWREWVQNLNIPTSFYDPTEPNDNFNERTSNYSTSPYTIKTVLCMNVQSGDGSLGNNFSTDYELFSDSSDILDFNNPGVTGFSHDYKLYDTNNDITDDLYTNQNVRIEIEFPHSLGIVSLNNIQGMIWIEKEFDTGQPYFLSTDNDYTNPLSPIQPSTKVTPANVEFVEIESINNLITLICLTNIDNLVKNQKYNIYGRVGQKL